MKIILNEVEIEAMEISVKGKFLLWESKGKLRYSPKDNIKTIYAVKIINPSYNKPFSLLAIYNVQTVLSLWDTWIYINAKGRCIELWDATKGDEHNMGFTILLIAKDEHTPIVTIFNKTDIEDLEKACLGSLAYVN